MTEKRALVCARSRRFDIKGSGQRQRDTAVVAVSGLGLLDRSAVAVQEYYSSAWFFIETSRGLP